MQHGAGAHGTRLQGNKELATVQPVVAQHLRGGTQGFNFRVSGGVVELDWGVGTFCKQLAAGVDDYGANRDFSAQLTGFGQLESMTHPEFVARVQRRSPARGCLWVKGSP